MQFVLFKSQGVETQKYPGPELLKGVDQHVENGWTLLHPLNDVYLIAGYAPYVSNILKILDFLFQTLIAFLILYLNP